MVTPRILSEFSRAMPSSCGGGVAAVFRLGFRKTISLVFATFSLRLLAAAQVAIMSISGVRVPTLADGTTRYVSSANLTSEFPECIGLRSARSPLNQAPD